MDFLSFKALAIAGQQGQKIWTIDKNNLDLALSKINLGADAESDIRNAVNAGRVATAHESRINFNGWIGEGYILMDPKTGAGGYMISGGGNGSETVFKAADMLNWISFAAGLKLAMYIAPWAAPLGLLLAGVNIFTTLLSLSLSCPGVFDTVAQLSIWFFSIAFLALGMFLVISGPLGILTAILMSILIQGLSTYVGRSVKDACRL